MAAPTESIGVTTARQCPGRPASESRRRWRWSTGMLPKRSARCTGPGWGSPERSARTPRTGRRLSGLRWSRRRRRIGAGHRGAEARRGNPEGAREQRTGDETLDLHCRFLLFVGQRVGGVDDGGAPGPPGGAGMPGSAGCPGAGGTAPGAGGCQANGGGGGGPQAPGGGGGGKPKPGGGEGGAHKPISVAAPKAPTTSPANPLPTATPTGCRCRTEGGCGGGVLWVGSSTVTVPPRCCDGGSDGRKRS